MFLRLLRTFAVLVSFLNAVSSYRLLKPSIRVSSGSKLNFSSIQTAKFSPNRLATTKLHSLGTDLLERPDDEDSPEFKEYLRQLMAMQVNRSKSGFAAPSSASADAYLAKLNRIKLERMKLRELGLPDDAVDTGYKPEDYQNAK